MNTDGTDDGLDTPPSPSTADTTYDQVRDANHGSDPERDRGLLTRLKDKVVGNADGDRTEPHPVRGWEAPADEQLDEPGDGPGETHASP